jgi:hypothetical protein
VATWAPPDDRQRPPYISLGLQHPAGTRAVSRLADAGVDVDPRWRVLSDHPRRGAVIAIPVDEDPATVLSWLLRALRAVSFLPFDGWVANVHRGR